MNNNSIMENEQSLSNLFADETENDYVFGDQSMAGSLSVLEPSRKSQRTRSTMKSSMHASKSISTLFSTMAWSGSCTSFVGSEEFSYLNSSVEDLEGSALSLVGTKNLRRKKFTTKYKHAPRTLKTKSSPITCKSDVFCESEANGKKRMLHAPTFQCNDSNSSSNSIHDFVQHDTIDTTLDSIASVADVATLDFSKSTDSEPVKVEEAVRKVSIPSDDARRKPKRGLIRKDSCLFESGRNKLLKSTNCNKEDVAPKCPRRCESPKKTSTRSLRVRVNVKAIDDTINIE